MARNSNYSAGKRQREIEKAKKKKQKELRKRERAASSGDNIPIASVEELQGGLMSADDVVRRMMPGDEEGEEAGGRKTLPSRLFIGGLSWSVTTDQLRAKFETIGPVNDAIVVLDRDTGDSRGFGFVTMADRKDAAEAIRKLNGEDFEGRSLVVRQATERGR